MYLQKVISRNFFKLIFVGVLKVKDEKSMIRCSESGSISQRHGSADPDPHQNVMDPQHWGSDKEKEVKESRQRKTTKYI